MRFLALSIGATHVIVNNVIGNSFGNYNLFETDNTLNTASLGTFLISWDDHDPYFEIRHKKNPSKILFRTLPMQPFVTIGYATDSKPPIVDGNFKVNEWTLFETPYQNIQKVISQKNQITIFGDVWGLVTKANYRIAFSVNKTISNQLFMNLSATSVLGTFNRLFLNHWSDPTESFHGFGVQYTHWNLKGLRVPIVVAEQGIGRGMQPLTTLLNVMADGTGGDPLTTYAPKPMYITSKCRSMVFDNSQIMFFDLRDANAIVVELWGTELTGSLLYGESMLDLITEVTLLTGRMKPLPAWTQEGAIVGLEGGTEEVREQVEEMRAHNISIAGVWLQDWVGLRHAYDGDRLMWNWVLDPSYYPHWNEMVDKWSRDNIRVLTYINPFFSDPATAKATSTRTNPHAVNEEGDETLSVKYRNLFQEGLANKYFVQNNAGSSYRLHSGSIEFCMLDTSNPSAREWMKDVIKYEMIRNTSSSGWMADFGEYLPFDSVLHNGMSAAEYHNIYPQEWAKINEEAVREAKQAGVRQIVTPSKYKDRGTGTVAGNVNADDDEAIYFMRSAWLKSPAHTALFWLGDQLVSWDRYDGIKTVLVGALSGGLGGHALTHSDIGGYTMQEFGPFPNVRTRELMYRWIELEAFGSAVFRTHIGSLVSPNNVQIYQDKEVMLYFGKFTNIFKHLSVYRKKLMKEAYEKGWPLVRSMAAHFGSDDKTWSIHSQYMFGDEIMIAPVTDSSRRTYNFGSRRGKNSVSLSEFADYTVRGAKVYVPANTEWTHLWSGQTVEGGDQGRYVSVDVPFGCIPVFYVPGSVHGEKLREFVLANEYDAVYVPRGAKESEWKMLGADKSNSAATNKDISLVTELSSLSSSSSDSLKLTYPVSDALGDRCSGSGKPISTNERCAAKDVLQTAEVAAVSSLSLSSLTPLTKKSNHVVIPANVWGFERSFIGSIVLFTEWTWLDWLGLSEYSSFNEESNMIQAQTKTLDVSASASASASSAIKLSGDIVAEL